MNGFNIKEGIINTVEKALEKDGFLESIFEILLGDEQAGEKAKQILMTCGNELTLNEMVAINRLLKKPIMESGILGNIPEKAKLQKVFDVAERSHKIQSKIIADAMKDPKVLVAIGRVVSSEGADIKADAVVARALIKSGIKAYREEKGEPQEQGVVSEEGLEEAFDPDTSKHVSLFVGRFQPFTLGHVKCLKKLQEKFKVPVLICAIPVTEEKADKEHPFYGKLQDEMYERLKDGLNDEFPGLLAENGVTYVPNAYLGNLIAEAKNLGYQPIGWGCGTDRYEIITPRKRRPKEGESPFVRSGYLPQTEKYVAQQNELDPEERDIDTDPENGFKLHHIQRDILGTGDDPVSKISGTKVREAIKEGDESTYNTMMPQCLQSHELFERFREALLKIEAPETEPAYQITGSLKEDKEYFAYRKRLDEAITRLVTGKGRK